MDIGPFVEEIHRQIMVAADAGGEDARALAERIYAPVEAAVRLALQDALAAAAEEITTELAPGSVELRVRGRQPEFVVTLPGSGHTSIDDDAGSAPPEPGRPHAGSPGDDEEASMSRINLRMNDRLKARIEQAASGEGMSVNSWLVRAATAALERSDRPRSSAPRTTLGSQRFTGWAR